MSDKVLPLVCTSETPALYAYLFMSKPRSTFVSVLGNSLDNGFIHAYVFLCGTNVHIHWNKKKMTITAYGTRKNANKPRPDPPTGLAPAKVVKDTIVVCEGSPEPPSHASEAQHCAPSQKATRTPPQQQACLPPPCAPSKPTHRATVLSNFADTDDEAGDTQDTGGWGKGEKPTSIVQALCTIRDKLAAMRTSGSNNTTKADIMATLHEAIDMATDQERENGTEWNPTPEPSTYDRRISNIEKDIKEIKEAILNTTAGKPKSWAQIAAGRSTGTSIPEIRLEVAKKERLEKAKKERAKTEVAITLRDASNDIRQHVESMQEKAIAETLQQGIRDRLASTGAADVKIRGVRKPSKHILKVLCETEEDASIIQQLKWESILDGATTLKPAYGVVIHGVPKCEIDTTTQNQDEIKEYLESINDIKVTRTTLLMKKARNPSAPTQSIIVFMERPEEADNCIMDGVRIENRIYPAERYIPQCQIRQCYNCQGYGHRADTCTKAPKCGKCAQEHETRKCNNSRDETLVCAQCGGPHTAWHHECPKRRKESERLELMRATTPLTFIC